jgi:hypothetical protein
MAMPDDDLVYLLRRAVEERRRADGCDNEAARASHRGLAEAYEDRVRHGSRRDVKPISVK